MVTSSQQGKWFEGRHVKQMIGIEHRECFFILVTFRSKQSIVNANTV